MKTTMNQSYCNSAISLYNDFGIAYDAASSRHFLISLVGRQLLSELINGREITKEVLQNLLITEKDYHEFITWCESHGFVDKDSRWVAKLERFNINNNSNLKGPLVVFIETTSTCNLHCRHCFNDAGQKGLKELTLSELDDFFSELRLNGTLTVVLTGGEALMRPDIFDVIMAAKKHGLAVCLESNATLIDVKIANQLKTFGINSVQVSLQGSLFYHDYIRGAGSFMQATDGIRCLTSIGIAVSIRMDLSKENIKDIPFVVSTADDLGCNAVLLALTKNTGRAKNNARIFPRLEGEDIYQLVKTISSVIPISKCVIQFPPFLYSLLDEDTLMQYSILQCKTDNSEAVSFSHCNAGQVACICDSKGNIFPCGFIRSSDFCAGNIRQIPFNVIWNESPQLNKFRKKESNQLCEGCSLFRSVCSSGCRARVILASGNLSGPDPYCVEQHGSKKRDSDHILEVIKASFINTTPTELPSNNPIIIRDMTYLNANCL
ncbi:MAG: radical SAM protein [Deltaproteobacteria bacterium]|nr:radical SAM protein [Deltaproteobacteria bacterium]